MTSTEQIEELFGTELARKLTRSDKYGWGSIQEALTTEYQEYELNPPEDNPISETRPNTRIGVCDDTLTVIERAKHEYKLTGKKEAITKSLRFGLSDMHYRWEDELTELNEAEEAASITSSYLHRDDFTQSLLFESDDIDVPTRQPAQQGSKGYRILWYENLLASSLSEDLGITKSEICRCGILLAGKELGQVGDLPSPREEQLEESIEKFDRQIQNRIDRAEQLVFGAIDMTAETELTEQVVDELQTMCPYLWEQYCSTHQAMGGFVGDD